MNVNNSDKICVLALAFFVVGLPILAFGLPVNSAGSLRSLEGLSDSVRAVVIEDWPPSESLEGDGSPGDSDLFRDWESLPAPVKGAQQIYGTYSSGCILGAKEIPISSARWEMVNTRRNRHYGHRALHEFLERLGNFAVAKSYGKLILGDTSLPAGGKLAYGHASHQLGIESDVRFQTFRGSSMSLSQRNSWPQIHYAEQREVTLSKNSPVRKVLQSRLVKGNFKLEALELVRFAAEDSAVNRIFVSPAIKRKMCDVYRLENGGISQWPRWLLKVRPYFEHTAHFHVRLECPSDSPACVSQGLPTVDPTDITGVGCSGDALAWWLTGVDRDQRIQDKEGLRYKDVPHPPAAPTPPAPPVPVACKQTLASQIIVKLSSTRRCLGEIVPGNGEGGKLTLLRCRDFARDKSYSARSKCTPTNTEKRPSRCLF